MADKVVLIDYGAGNLHSVYNALKVAGSRSANNMSEIIVSNDPKIVSDADRIVLPGVGAFGSCRDALFSSKAMIDALQDAVIDRAVPFLGICVGMQLLANEGLERGRHEGLGWIKGSVRAVETLTPDIKVPHMGWNDVSPVSDAPLIETGEAYYLHGYHFVDADDAHVLARTHHGVPMVAAVGRDNIMGVQFHPEKSQQYGLDFLGRFLRWRP